MKLGRSKVWLLVILLIIVVGLGFSGYWFFVGKTQKRSAVFMTNGQVYFGYLGRGNDKNITLKNVYYLKTQDLQNSSNAKILLVKMGNELHGPEGNMTISRNQVLFSQTLRDDSKINDAINRFNQNASTPQPTTSPTPSASQS